jgi:hypothetical protein
MGAGGLCRACEMQREAGIRPVVPGLSLVTRSMASRSLRVT